MKRFIFNQLKAWKEKKNRKPLILRGVRQVGKTYILKEFGRACFPKTHYINFEENKMLRRVFDEDLTPRSLLQKLSFHLNQPIALSDLLIFDEIQECPNALTSLKYFAEELPEQAICSAGSLLGVYLGPVSFPVGKVNILFMYPMSFEEFLVALDETKSLEFLEDAKQKKQLPEIVHMHLWERLKWYYITGGLPEVVQLFSKTKENLFQATQEVRELQKELILSYLADMAKHSGKINAMHLDRLWQAIPEQLAKSQDTGIKKFVFKDAIAGVNRFDRLIGVIDWLEKAGLVIKVSIVNSGLLPFSAFSKDNTFKLMLFDVGILGALSHLDPKELLQQDYGTYKGYFAENFVAQEFLCSGHEALFSWQENTAEVEFLMQIQGQVVPVEVKSGTHIRSKSLQLFASKYQSPFRIILSGQNLSYGEGIIRVPLYLAGQLLNYLGRDRVVH